MQNIIIRGVRLDEIRQRSGFVAAAMSWDTREALKKGNWIIREFPLIQPKNDELLLYEIERGKKLLLRKGARNVLLQLSQQSYGDKPPVKWAIIEEVQGGYS